MRRNVRQAGALWARPVSLILAVLVLTPAIGLAQTLSFLQMSDTQFGMYTENRDFAQETANFEFVVANANRLKPRFVVACGDLVNRSGDADQIAEFHRIAKKFATGIDLHVVAGNHDVGNTPTPESLAIYRKNFGNDYYTFSLPDFEGIVLDSSLIQHPEGAPGEAAKQEKWLEAELGKAKQSGVKWIVVFQHIPFFVTKPDEPDDYFNIPQAVRSRYLDLLKRSDVHYVFAGHLHHNSLGDSGPLHMISTGPVGKPLETGASGFRVVQIDSTGLKHQFFDFAHLPNQLESRLQ
jgi:3',5'-cyclic AMP phosphodiesterase CpdA